MFITLGIFTGKSHSREWMRKKGDTDSSYIIRNAILEMLNFCSDDQEFQIKWWWRIHQIWCLWLQQGLKTWYYEGLPFPSEYVFLLSCTSRTSFHCPSSLLLWGAYLLENLQSERQGKVHQRTLVRDSYFLQPFHTVTESKFSLIWVNQKLVSMASWLLSIDSN